MFIDNKLRIIGALQINLRFTRFALSINLLFIFSVHNVLESATVALPDIPCTEIIPVRI